MKTSDTMNLANTLQEVMEDVKARLKKLEEDNTSRHEFDQTISKKISVYENNLEYQNGLVNNLDKRMQKMEGFDFSNMKQAPATQQQTVKIKEEPVIAPTEAQPQQPTTEVHPTFGGGFGGGMANLDNESMKDINSKIKEIIETAERSNETIKNNATTIDKLKKRITDLEDSNKDKTAQQKTLTKNLEKLDNDVGFKVDNDTFQHAVNSKLCIEEFNTKMSENAMSEDKIKFLANQQEKLQGMLDKEFEKFKKKARSNSSKIKDLTSKLEFFTDIDKNENLKKALEMAEKVEGLGDYSFHIRKDLDDVIGSVKKLTNILRTMKQDQIKSLANTRAVLCLSCGRGDVNFMPPTDYVKGEDGRFYKTDFVVKNNQILSVNNPEEEFEYGIDAFTRHEIVKEHTQKAHLPVDLVMQNQQQNEMKNIGKKIRPMSAMHGGGIFKGRGDKDRLPNLDMNRGANTSQENLIPPVKAMNINRVKHQNLMQQETPIKLSKGQSHQSSDYQQEDNN